MYKPQIYSQLTCTGFDQFVGLKINPENRWIKKVARIPWIELEKKHAKKFLNK